MDEDKIPSATTIPMDDILAEYATEKSRGDEEERQRLLAELREQYSLDGFKQAYHFCHYFGYFLEWEGIAAVGQKQPSDVFVEAARNIAAATRFFYGDKPWNELLGIDEEDD